MRILRLTLKKKWFDLIAAGRKPVEYRDVKKHWTQRLMVDGSLREFDEVHFTNGYGPDRPFMRVEWKGVSVMTYAPAPMNHELTERDPRCGEPLVAGKLYYVIALGAVLEVRRYHTPEIAGSGQRHPCVSCKQGPTPEGHDACLGTLKGNLVVEFVAGENVTDQSQ